MEKEEITPEGPPERAVLKEVLKLLADHPVNVGVGEGEAWRPLEPGEEGYDHRARAYLAAKEALK